MRASLLRSRVIGANQRGASVKTVAKRRIRDLPRGGGAESGAVVWFALVLEDGGELELSLRADQLDAFIAGLQTFQGEAAALAARNGVKPPGPAHLVTTRFEAGLSPDRTLLLTFGDDDRGLVRIAVPQTRVKRLLGAIVEAMSSLSSPSGLAAEP